MGTFEQFIEIIVVWLIIGEESHDTTSLYIYNPHKIFITFSNLCPNLRCVKQNLLLQFSFSIRLQLALKLPSANRRRIEKQKASQHVAMCYYYPQSHNIDRVTGRLFKPSGCIYTSFGLYWLGLKSAIVVVGLTEPKTRPHTQFIDLKKYKSHNLKHIWLVTSIPRNCKI